MKNPQINYILKNRYFICAPSGETIILIIHHDISVPTTQHTLLVYDADNPLKWWKLMGHMTSGGALEAHCQH